MTAATHPVTVYNRVPATRAISRDQVEAYLRRLGWTRSGVEFALRGEGRLPVYLSARALEPGCLPATIAWLAEQQGRQPGDVLDDIAEDQG